MKRRFFAVIFYMLILSFAFCDVLVNPSWDFAVDLPEGFELKQKSGNDSFLFEHPDIPVSIVLRAYSLSRYKDTKTAASNVMKQLGAKYESSDCQWRNSDAKILQFSMNLNGAQEGWGVVANLPDKKGIIVMLAYTPKAYAQNQQVSDFLFSCLDSLIIDWGCYTDAGPITAFAFPKSEQKDRVSHKITIDGKKISFTLDPLDQEADEFVIEREYSVLCMYQNSKKWKEAWQRYYRQIFRNECGRLSQAAFAIQNKLRSKCSTDAEYAQTLLSWVQGFDYARDHKGTDFAPVTKVICGEGSDCDSRSMLLAVLLHHMNMDTAIFVSSEYSHALFGVALEGYSGAKLKSFDTTYVLGETTAQVDLGLVAADMADPAKWIPVSFF